jgi:carboxyl-terminal processing protease
MKERESTVSDQEKKKRTVSVGVLFIAILISFTAGNRLQTIGDYFFAPYTNKGNQALSQNLDFAETEKIFDLLKQKYDGKLEMSKLQDGLNKGLVDAAGDPYTTYMSEAEASEFQADLDGTFSGIGAELGKKNDRLVVISPIEGSPARAAGVRAGDIIAKINDEDTAGLSVDAAVNKIRGEAGTDIKLTFIRADKPVELTITRAKITVPSVKSEILEGNIGYLQITRFSDDTATLAATAAQEFKAKNVRGVVVDVRNNGGGLLDSAVKVAGLWLNNKVVVAEKQGGRVTAELRSGNNPPLAGIPTTMLINEGSASASEILAGALHDHGAAKLVGKKSFGKGSVQELIDLPNGGKLKVTVARWFTPNGKNIDKEGIKPDIEVNLSDEDFNNDQDPQKDRAASELK